MKIELHIIESDLDRQRLIQKLRTEPLLDDRGQPLVVHVARPEPGRTLAQNALLWRWHGIVADATGYSKRQVHEFIRSLFMEPRIVEIGGQTREILPSTSDLTVTEMKIYLDQYQAWAQTDLGISLPQGKNSERRAAMLEAVRRAAA